MIGHNFVVMELMLWALQAEIIFSTSTLPKSMKAEVPVGVGMEVGVGTEVGGVRMVEGGDVGDKIENLIK